MLNQSSSDGALTVEIGSAFVPEDAVRIHDLIERTAPGTVVEIDLHRVRECHDVALRGVSQHQLRVLGYFGVHVGEPVAGEA